MFPSKIGSYSGTSVASSNLVAEVATDISYSSDKTLWFRSIKLIVGGACDIKVNDGAVISLTENEVFELKDFYVSSLTIEDAGVTFTLIYIY